MEHINYEWFDIEIFDRVDEEVKVYTKEMLEQLTNHKFKDDKFVAIQCINDVPTFWFTTNYVCYVDRSHLWSDKLIILPRNPES